MAGTERIAVSLRPGIIIPDWSVVRSNAAALALNAVLTAFNIETRWAGRDEIEDRVHIAILCHFFYEGHAPSLAELAAVTGMTVAKVCDALGRLRDRDMVVLGPEAATITGAYPLTEKDTGHRVHLGDRVVNAMCAIDAMGAGAMYGSDTTVESSCGYCETPVRLELTEGGTALGAAMPSGAIVWSGIDYSGGCAADSLCTVMMFFCSDDHLAAWRKEIQSDSDGYRLSLDEARQVGSAIFAPLLRRAPEVRGESRLQFKHGPDIETAEPAVTEEDA